MVELIPKIRKNTKAGHRVLAWLKKEAPNEE